MSFNSYAKDEFNDAEQILFAEFCKTLDILSHTWILSNSDVKGKNPNDDFFDELYKNINRVIAKRSINVNVNFFGVPLSSRAFSSNIFVRPSQKGFSLQSLTQKIE